MPRPTSNWWPATGSTAPRPIASRPPSTGCWPGSRRARRDAGRAAIQAQERERRRIAQDLHDEVNQALTAVSLRLQASIAHAPEDLRRELIETKRLAGQAMEELLALARQLRPAVLDDLGLLPDAEEPGARLRRPDRHPGGLQRARPVPSSPPEQQLVVYRVTQESLSNVAQHSGADKVDVELSFEAGHPGCASSTTGAASPRGARVAWGCRACASAPCWPAANFRSGPPGAREREWS